MMRRRKIFSARRSFSVSANRSRFFPSFCVVYFRKSLCETKTRISTTGHTAWLALGGVSPPWVESVVEELLQTVGGLEDLGDLAVQLANHLVDGLLPRRVCVLSSHDGVEELSKGDLGHLQEAIRNLGGRGTAERAEVVNGNQYFSSEKASLPQTPCLDWKTTFTEELGFKRCCVKRPQCCHQNTNSAKIK